jgi:hypothetical protein
MGTRFKTDEPTYVTPPMPKPAVWPRASVPEYGPRVVRLTKATRFGVGFLGSLAAASVLIGGLVVANQAQKGTIFVREGQVVSAKVIGYNNPRGSDKKYRLEYEYRFQGRNYRQWGRVRKAFFETNKDRSTIDVTVLPRDPKTHQIGRVDKAGVEKDVATGSIIVVLLAGLFGGLAGLIRASAQKEARILTDWTAVSAQVLEKKKMFGGQNGQNTYKVKLRYRVPRQAEIETETKLTRGGNWNVEPGSFIDIFYDPEDVTRIRVRDGMTAAEIDPSTY